MHVYIYEYIIYLYIYTEREGGNRLTDRQADREGRLSNPCLIFFILNVVCDGASKSVKYH